MILPNLAAGCSMADMADIDSVTECWEQLEELYGTEPDADGRVPVIPVTYMNSSAALKAFCGEHGGIVCTSSNAATVLEWAFERGQRVLFFPDQHLGRNTAKAMGVPLDQMPMWNPRKDLGGNDEQTLLDSRVILWHGFCSVHKRFTVGQIEKARAEHPGVHVIVHPECPMAVVDAADAYGSTDFIGKAIAAATEPTTFAIGTEINLVNRLAAEYPQHTIFCLDPVICPCSTMYRIHPGYLAWVLEALVGEGERPAEVLNRITVSDDVAGHARVALERMLAAAAARDPVVRVEPDGRARRTGGLTMASVLVVGSGLAGLIAAVRATDSGHTVTLVTKAALPESNTRYAQGGIAAALFPDDSVDTHMLDTLRAGAGLCSPDAVRVLCTEGPARVRDLIRFGVDFDRDESGLTRGLEAAHSRSRVLHAGGDATGAVIEAALVATVRGRAARGPGMRILEHTMLIDVVVRDGRVTGAIVAGDGLARLDGLDHRVLEADAVILATGGAGSLYLHTTNPDLATGDGVAAAWRAGASVADLEFYQFHPTALAVPGTPLVSEAVRGEGATLLNRQGRRFMARLHPGAELAPRDVVARGIAREMARQGGEPVLLDATMLGRELLERRFPTITAACVEVGLDWAREPIPVAPAAHYWMGGVVTDLWGRSTLPGLFAVGEVARTGAHGANRLASNSLLEAAVFADRAVRALGDSAGVADWPDSVDSVDSVVTTTRTTTTTATAATAGAVDRDALQRLMWHAAGVLRSGDGLTTASATLSGWTRPAAGTRADAQARARAHEDANLLDLARLTVDAALAREESRGAHHRADFPAARPELARPLAWTLASGRTKAKEAIAC